MSDIKRKHIQDRGSSVEGIYFNIKTTFENVYFILHKTAYCPIMLLDGCLKICCKCINKFEQ